VIGRGPAEQNRLVAGVKVSDSERKEGAAAHREVGQIASSRGDADRTN